MEPSVQEMQMELSKEKNLKREMESQLFESHIEVQRCRDMIKRLLQEKLEIEQELRGYKQLKDGEMQQLQCKINDALSNAERLLEAKSKAEDRWFAAEESLAEAQRVRSEMQHQLAATTKTTQLLLNTKHDELVHVKMEFEGDHRR